MLDTFKKATPEALAAVAEEKRVRQTQSLILLFSMGSQFDHLIYQMVSKLGVYCLVADPASVPTPIAARWRRICFASGRRVRR